MTPARVLFVSESAHNRLLGEALLVDAGYEVALAKDSQETLSRFQAFRPDVVIVDMHGSGDETFDTCRWLRALAGGVDVSIVLLTALNDLDTYEEAVAAGVDDFLSKPINRTELVVRVASRIWLRRLRGDVKRGLDVIRAQRDALLSEQKKREELMELIVHDLKNPLTTVLGYSRYLCDGDSLNDDQRAICGDIVRAAEAMLRMVLDILDVSRADEGGLLVHVTDVDLGAVIADVVRSMRARGEEPSHEIVVVDHLEGQVIEGDVDLVRRVVENLLDNSMKYTPRPGRITIETSKKEDEVEIVVRDQGPGIPLEYRDKVFEKYVRLERDAGQRARVSRGLGLAFCRLAVEAHGGRIWVEQGEPKGAVFRIRLPVWLPATSRRASPRELRRG